MKYFLLLPLLLLCSCFATSRHVDKSEKLSVDLLEHILKDDIPAQPVLKELKLHVEEGSGVSISPEVVSGIAGLADGVVPGLGILLTTVVGVYAKKKKDEASYMTYKSVQAAKETDKDKALKSLADDPNVKGYNG